MLHVKILTFHSAMLKATNPMFCFLCNICTTYIDTHATTYSPKWVRARAPVLFPVLLVMIHRERSTRFITNGCQEL